MLLVYQDQNSYNIINYSTFFALIDTFIKADCWLESLLFKSFSELDGLFFYLCYNIYGFTDCY